MASVDMTTSCPEHGAVAANEVVWIGDGWLTTGVQVTSVRDMARAIGAIGPNDDYIDLAGNGATMSMVANQYNMAASRTPKPKVLIMDGGTIETMNDTSAATVRTVTSTFTQLLARIAADGTVSDIIYILVPELPLIAAAVTAIRPSFQQACAQSAVPCYFIDLQPIWAANGGHPEYTASNGILPTTSGALALANAIWMTMKSNCIAQ
jgi:hypothetical protein